MRTLLLLFLLCAAATAAAQEPPRVGRDGYRLDVPGVLEPPRPPPRPPETPFGAAYRRAGFPRMVLFFNRDLSDVASSGAVLRRRDELTVEGDAQLRERAPQPGAAMLPAAEGRKQAPSDRNVDEHARLQASRTTEVTVERAAVGARTPPLDEATQWLFETAFGNRLGTERVRMVDRSTAIRLAAASATTQDPQRLEMTAIRGQAEIMLLVRQSLLGQGAEARRFVRLTAIDTRSGAILADDVVTPPAGDPATAASAAGDMAAANLLGRLTTTWTPPR